VIFDITGSGGGDRGRPPESPVAIARPVDIF
jgi:hypothetical protein